MTAQTIDEVIIRLEEIIFQSVATNSRLGIFAQLYLHVTRQVRDGIQQGRFKDGSQMERLDVIFANRYLTAFEHYQRGLTCTASWKTAFDASKERQLIVLQHLLMGMNAHINLDLGIAASEAVPPDQLPALEYDFFEINRLLTEKINEMQDKLSSVSPLLFLLDIFGKKSDEKFAEFSLKKARSHAWNVAQRLSWLSPVEKTAEIEELDRYVSVLNRLITEPGIIAGALVKLVYWLEMKDVKKIMLVLG
jgi:hypothetical protein